MRTIHRFGFGSLVLAGLGVAGCVHYQAVDTAGLLRQEIAARAPEQRDLAAPFELNGEILGILERQYKPGPNELRRVDQVLDFVFRRLNLRYALEPTRNAVETYYAREGNCLSFVNLFVGVARHQRLTPFYVEVTDYQRWNYAQGLVVSRGHIVAGMYVKGELKTYDFLPYRAKAYRDFKPIDDLTAAAHYYNNLGAEALLAGDTSHALEELELAAQIAPGFVKGLNNLGVAYARTRQLDKAIAAYQRGLAIEPADVALLTNLARAYQDLGRLPEAEAMLAKVEGANSTNPFFFVYQAELALAGGNAQRALDYLVDALRQDSEIPEIHVALVKVYLALGDVGRARHHLERALRLDATNPEARRLAAMLGNDAPPGGN